MKAQLSLIRKLGGLNGKPAHNCRERGEDRPLSKKEHGTADKIAVITGAARGIGGKCGTLFCAAVDLGNRREVHRLSDLLPLTLHRLSHKVSELGNPNVLFNNAGIAVVGELEEISEADWDRQYAVNVKSIYLVSRAVIPRMREAGGGSIINMASESAYVGFPMHPAYTSSKAAVVHLSRSMAVRYAEDNIRVNSLCPGTINTELYQEFLSQQPDPEAINKEIKEMHPLGIGEPEDIAWAAVYLASDESRYMTGCPDARRGWNPIALKVPLVA